MGYCFRCDSKEEQIQELLRQSTFENDKAKVVLLDHSLRGSELYTLQYISFKDGRENGTFVTIDVHLLKKSGGLWGCKSMNICEEPYYYNAPKKFLNLVTDPSESSKNWVKKCLENKSNETSVSPSEMIGKKVVIGGVRYTVKSEYDRKNMVIISERGDTFRCTKKFIRGNMEENDV